MSSPPRSSAAMARTSSSNRLSAWRGRRALRRLVRRWQAGRIANAAAARSRSEVRVRGGSGRN
jgi:hypothetical protein